MYSPFCSFSWEGFCFLYPFFSRIEISHQPNLGWRPAIQRPEPEDIGFYVCVASPLPPIPVPRKRVPWSPLYPKESGPLSFHSRRPSLFCRFCLISAQACLPSGASQRAKKKNKKNHFWLGDLLGGVGKATSPYHFWLEKRDLFRWTKMDGGIVFDYFLVKNSPLQFWFRNLLRSVYRACPK